MADRELLELAAKAAGHTFSWLNGDGAIEARKPGIMQPYIPWNPLTDDGDALRLAVKLKFALYPPECEEDGATVSAPGEDGIWHIEDRTDDPHADIRRAIVRAAAEIGRNMK